MFISTINIDKSKRLWIVILLALTIASLLITISFIYIYLKKDKNIEAVEIFDLKGYCAEYELVTFSNKNQNSYYIKEWYSNENESFKIEFENELKEKVTYVLTNNTLSINSDKQLSTFNIYEYNPSKTNLLSIGTFIELYNKVLNKNDNVIKIENKNVDNIKHYMIYLNNKDNEKINQNLEGYEDILNDGLKISKLELTVNEKNIPTEYYVFDEQNKIILGIKYVKFNIMDKFDEKIFAKFNK